MCMCMCECGVQAFFLCSCSRFQIRSVLWRATQLIWYVGSFMSADYLLLFAWIASSVFSTTYARFRCCCSCNTIGFLACNSTVLKLHLKWYRTFVHIHLCVINMHCVRKIIWSAIFFSFHSQAQRVANESDEMQTKQKLHQQSEGKRKTNSSNNNNT